jgi:hypothetical protein
MVVYDYNPSTQDLRQEDHEFKDSLCYIVTSCLKKYVVLLKIRLI